MAWGAEPALARTTQSCVAAFSCFVSHASPSRTEEHVLAPQMGFPQHSHGRLVSELCLQVEAERRKRATVLESEGTRESAINVAEGQKQAQILASEAEKAEQINKAAGNALG